MLLYCFLICFFTGQKEAYDFLDQVSLIKDRHPELKQLGVLVCDTELEKIEPAIKQLAVNLEVKAFVVELNSTVEIKKHLLAQQSVNQLIEDHQVDCILVYSDKNPFLKDAMVLKSISMIPKSKGLPVYSSHPKALALGFSGVLIWKKDHWVLEP